ncbi:sulfite exporter TauE/SafE family protein [Paraclostridium sordellii]|uniref:sulfite exporter TauE/SafE family protein n=1 Tax=Paraclostridium sordellii TaxID=1505 RepID=UPI0003860FD4|nr:sulfite exporter TauE/SafE family protein [Paeniclostridium sordellii]EPZ57971.1 sulfite exporter TauE/SafE family protein [[Clostridium] sordellii VPI 9048] [Paeniclostridium sordellii VPI 9048]CEK37461.1 putative undecaprenol kinase [[Clostridium] sordellii] [Paeniclostridium sordellii]
MGVGQILLFVIIVMVAYIIEGVIGFGGTIIAIPLASAIVGLKPTVPVLTIVVLIASTIIAIKDIKFINKKEFLKITTLMMVGLPIGMWLFESIPEKPLKIALGIFMVIIGIKGLYEEKRKSNDLGEIVVEIETNLNKDCISIEETTSKRLNIFQNFTIFCGGVLHGEFTCGGPFIVVYATKNIKDKTSFRATLCALWASLNLVMVGIDIYTNEITKDIIKLSFITMIFVFIAIIVSNIIHKK